jgi:hypothetical protein
MIRKYIPEPVGMATLCAIAWLASTWFTQAEMHGPFSLGLIAATAGFFVRDVLRVFV